MAQRKKNGKRRRTGDAPARAPIAEVGLREIEIFLALPVRHTCGGWLCYCVPVDAVEVLQRCRRRGILRILLAARTQGQKKGISAAADVAAAASDVVALVVDVSGGG